jgi:hypothetical protein
MSRPERSELAGLFRTIDPKTGRMMLSRGDADFFGRVIDELKRLGQWSAAPPLLLSDGPDGRSIGLGGSVGGGNSTTITEFAPPIFAKLSGTTSPYDFVQQDWINGFDIFRPTVGGATGTANAYEAYGRPALGGKYVQLFPVPGGDRWHFLWMRRAGCKPCSLKWGHDYHVTLVDNDPDGHICPNHVSASGTLFYQAGSIVDPSGSAVLGLPSSPGYWDTGCVAYSPYTDAYIPPNDYTHFRAILSCGTNNTILYYVLSKSQSVCEMWPPQPGLGALVESIGVPLGMGVGWNNTALQCNPLLIQWDYCGGFACPQLITDTGCTYQTITVSE